MQITKTNILVTHTTDNSQSTVKRKYFENGQ